MNENKEDDKSSRRPQRKFSFEEKRNYYIAWKKSGMSQIGFCKVNGISKSALYQWSKQFKKEDTGFGFSPIVLDKQPSIKKQADMIQLNVCFLNQIQLNIAVPEHRLISFIQELGHATAIIR